MSQSEDVAYNTNTGNRLQIYTLGYESHSRNPGDKKKILKNLMQNVRRYSENVQATKVKDQQKAQKWLKHTFQILGQSQDVSTNETSLN